MMPVCYFTGSKIKVVVEYRAGSVEPYLMASRIPEPERSLILFLRIQAAPISSIYSFLTGYNVNARIFSNIGDRCKRMWSIAVS
jgi:hypothetical protein